jgi:hypothetical protein
MSIPDPYWGGQSHKAGAALPRARRLCGLTPTHPRAPRRPRPLDQRVVSAVPRLLLPAHPSAVAQCALGAGCRALGAQRRRSSAAVRAGDCAIRQRERNGLVELPRRPVQRGDKVRVRRGPFEGHFGIYDGMTGHERAAVLLQVLGARVTLPQADIAEVM